MPDAPPGAPAPEPPGDATSADLARSMLARARAEARQRGRETLDRRSRQGRRPGDAAARRSSAGPDERDPQPLGHSVERLVTERGWEAPLTSGGVVGRWPELVGPELAEHCRPEALTDGVLTLRTSSSAWATQVRLLAPVLVQRLNQQLGHGSVLRIVVNGPAAPSWRRGPRRVPGRGPRDTYG